MFSSRLGGGPTTGTGGFRPGTGLGTGTGLGLGPKKPIDLIYMRDLYNGDIAFRYFCTKKDGEYRLFFIGNKAPTNEVSGKLVTDDGLFMGKDLTIPKKGEYIELRMGNFEKVPIFKPKTKVLALKPTGDTEFEKKFTVATVVSGPTDCPRRYNGPSFGGKNSFTPSRERLNSRHSYTLKFKGEETPRTVYEEFIIPLEKYWNKEKDVYGPSSDSSDYSESSSSSSSTEESESSSSSSSDEKLKHKKHHQKKGKHNKHCKHHKYHKGTKAPQIVIVPVFIPYSQYPNYLPY